MSLYCRIAVLSVACVLQPALAGAQLIISEFRLRGAAGANDEFIEIYNNTGDSHTVAATSGTGYGIAASDGTTRCSIPNGTIIPSRGHYLCANSLAYSLAGYATANTTYTTAIADNAGIALFNNNSGGGSYSLANRLDAVGSTSEGNAIYKEGTGYGAITPFTMDSSLTRLPAGSCTGSGPPPNGNCSSVALIQSIAGPTTSRLLDTGNNASDFIFVDTNGTNAGAGQRLGAPGPENLASPISRVGFDLVRAKLDQCRHLDAPPNLVRTDTSIPVENSTFGQWDIRSTFTNMSGVPLTRLRFRIIDITTFPSAAGVADLRPITSSDLAVTVDPAPCGTGTSNVTVRGTTLEQPPSQPNGSGYNGSLSVGAVSAGTPLAAGASVNVRFLMGIQQTGAARFCVAAETIPATGSQIFCLLDETNASGTFSNTGAITIPAGGAAAPYPSNITVGSVTGVVTKVTVTLKEITHAFPIDIDVLLVGPTGVKFILMSNAFGSSAVAGKTYTFDSSAAAVLPTTGPASGIFQPTNYGGGDTFPSPAPAGPYLSPSPDGTDSLRAFNGLNPNGTWSLYVFDDFPADGGTIAGGWELSITTSLPPVTSDFNGNGVSEPAVYRPSTSTWFAPSQSPTQWGLPGDVIVPGDYNGDMLTERAVYRPSSGTWHVQNQTQVQWGLPGDIPVPGDYNGAGMTELAVYRPSTSTWFVLNRAPVPFGLVGDIPVPGDYNGDLATDIAVWRPSNGTWYMLNLGWVQFGLSGDIPVPDDYTGGGVTDPAVYRPSTGTWHIYGQPSRQWGLPGDIPVPGDYDGDARADLAVFRPSNGSWYIKFSLSGYTTDATVQFGLPGDIPIPNSGIAYVLALRSTLATLSRVSDFDADRISDLTVFRPSSATWFTLRSSSDFVSSTSVPWGLSGDVPVSHDYDGDGQTDFAVYRPSTGGWFFLRSSTGYSTSTALSFGLSGDVPVPGDYDGDSATDPAVFRPSTGDWHILFSGTGYTTNAVYQWGLSGDVPLTGDFDGDAKTDLTVYRPSNGTWFTRYSTTGYATNASFQWGLSGDITVPGEYDGDGKTDHAVYRPSSGHWFVLKSSTNQTTSSTQQWGLTSDIPVPGDFDGDRKTDVAVWRPSTATWFLLLSSTNFTVFDQVPWGLSGDIPILKRP